MADIKKGFKRIKREQFDAYMEYSKRKEREDNTVIVPKEKQQYIYVARQLNGDYWIAHRKFTKRKDGFIHNLGEFGYFAPEIKCFEKYPESIIKKIFGINLKKGEQKKIPVLIDEAVKV
jgi:hypothetical protein